MIRSITFMFPFICSASLVGLGCSKADCQRFSLVQSDLHPFIAVLFFEKISPQSFVQLVHVIDLSLANREDLIISFNLKPEALYLAGAHAMFSRRYHGIFERPVSDTVLTVPVAYIL